MKLRKLTAFILCILICFSAIACNSSDSGDKTYYTLTLHTNGATDVSPISLEAGKDISSAIPQIEKAFYTFDKWYLDDNFTMPYTLGVMPAANLDIYARWTPVSVYTINFVTYGSGISPVTGVIGESPARPQNPTRDNFEFAGWYTEPEFQNQFSFSSKPNNNLTLYASWTLAANAVKITFMGNSEVLYDCAVQRGQKLAKPSLFDVDIVYVDWYETDSSAPFDFSKPVVTEKTNITLNTLYYTTGLSYDINNRDRVNGYTGSSATVIMKPGSELSPYAFYGNTTVKKIILPSGLGDIPDYAFYGCKNLKEIYIPATVTSIGNSAFFACENLKLTAGDNLFRIPNNVTTIGARAFLGCKSLTDVSFSTRLATVGVYAFGDTGLKTLNLKNTSITVITEGAFSNCTALKSVILPSLLTSIGIKAFYNCLTASSFFISNTVNTIGEEAFARCTSIEEFVIEEGSIYYKVDEENNLYDFNGTTLLLCLSSESEFKVAADSKLETIQRNAFYGNTFIKKITIEKSVNLTKGSFEGCTNLETLTLYDFGKTAPLTLGVMFGAPYAEDNTIDNMYTPQTLSTVRILSPALTSIPEYAFFGCAALSTITIDNNNALTGIGKYAFAYTAILTFTIGTNLNTMGENVFTACEKLAEIQGSNSYFYKSNDCFYYDNGETGALQIKRLIKALGAHDEIIVDTDTTDIDNYAFYKYSYNLKHLSIPFIGASVTNNDNMKLMHEIYTDPLGTDDNEYAGDYFAFLPYIFGSPLADLNEVFSPLLDKLTLSKSTHVDMEIIPWAAFYFCDIKVFDFTAVADTLTHYGSWAFAKNAKIEGFVKATDDDTLTAFYNPHGPEENDKGIQFVGDYTFYECHLVDATKTLTLDKGIEEIGEGSFCYNDFYNIDIKAELEIIPIRAFYMNVNIIGEYNKGVGSKETTVKIPKTVKEIHAYSFTTNDYSYDTVDASLNGNLTVIFEEGSQLKTFSEPSLTGTIVANCAFGSAGVRTIVFPDSLEYIGHKTFQYCPLTNMSFNSIDNSKLHTIYIAAFSNTLLMETLYLPPSLEEIGSNAFSLEQPLYRVTAVKSHLKTIVIGVPEVYDEKNDAPVNRLRYFSYDCFINQTGLKEVVLYKNVRAITADRQAKVDVLKSDLDDLNQELADLRVKLTGLTDADDITQTNADITVVNSKITAVKNDILNIQDLYGVPRMIKNTATPFKNVHPDFTMYVPDRSINFYTLDTVYNWARYQNVLPIAKWNS